MRLVAAHECNVEFLSQSANRQLRFCIDDESQTKQKQYFVQLIHLEKIGFIRYNIIEYAEFRSKHKGCKNPERNMVEYLMHLIMTSIKKEIGIIVCIIANV